MTDTEDLGSLGFKQTDKIKLIHKSDVKGQVRYDWEISILSLDIEQLEKLNKQMDLKFGGLRS